MIESPFLAEGFESLRAARARASGQRDLRRRLTRAVDVGLRWVFGAGAVWSGWAFWAWGLVGWPPDARHAGTLAIVSLYAAFVTLSLVLHSRSNRGGRQITSFELGLALGLVCGLLPGVLASWSHILEVALELPVVLVYFLVQDPLRAPIAGGMSLWLLGPLSVSLVSACDVVRAIRRRRGVRFTVRDAIGIALGLLLAAGWTIASPFWGMWSPALVEGQ